jgi:hypothetical protein
MPRRERPQPQIGGGEDEVQRPDGGHRAKLEHHQQKSEQFCGSDTRPCSAATLSCGIVRRRGRAPDLSRHLIATALQQQLRQQEAAFRRHSREHQLAGASTLREHPPTRPLSQKARMERPVWSGKRRQNHLQLSRSSSRLLRRSFGGYETARDCRFSRCQIGRFRRVRTRVMRYPAQWNWPSSPESVSLRLVLASLGLREPQ